MDGPTLARQTVVACMVHMHITAAMVGTDINFQHQCEI